MGLLPHTPQRLRSGTSLGIHGDFLPQTRRFCPQQLLRPGNVNDADHGSPRQWIHLSEREGSREFKCTTEKCQDIISFGRPEYSKCLRIQPTVIYYYYTDPHNLNFPSLEFQLFSVFCSGLRNCSQWRILLQTPTEELTTLLRTPSYRPKRPHTPSPLPTGHQRRTYGVWKLGGTVLSSV